MSDRRLRELERRASQGDKDAARHLFAAKVRLLTPLQTCTGHLLQPNDRIEVAAFCGHKFALEHLNNRWGGLPKAWLDGANGGAVHFMRGLERFPLEVKIRAYLESGKAAWLCKCAQCQDVIGFHYAAEETCKASVMPFIERDLEAVKAADYYLDCPCDEHKAVCLEFANTADTSDPVWRLACWMIAKGRPGETIEGCFTRAHELFYLKQGKLKVIDWVLGEEQAR